MKTLSVRQLPWVTTCLSLLTHAANRRSITYGAYRRGVLPGSLCFTPQRHGLKLLSMLRFPLCLSIVSLREAVPRMSNRIMWMEHARQPGICFLWGIVALLSSLDEQPICLVWSACSDASKHWLRQALRRTLA